MNMMKTLEIIGPPGAFLGLPWVWTRTIHTRVQEMPPGLMHIICLTEMFLFAVTWPNNYVPVLLWIFGQYIGKIYEWQCAHTCTCVLKVFIMPFIFCDHLYLCFQGHVLTVSPPTAVFVDSVSKVSTVNTILMIASMWPVSPIKYVWMVSTPQCAPAQHWWLGPPVVSVGKHVASSPLRSPNY